MSRRARYTAISKARDYTCALAGDGEAVCWGDDAAARLDAPAGSYTAISATVTHACALAQGGEAVCWGDPYSGQTDPTPGPYVAISTGFFGYHGATGSSCGLTTTGELQCWGLTRPTPLTGRFTALSSGGGHHCGLRDSGELVCSELWEAPPGVYSAVSIGGNWAESFICALTDVGEVVCWGGSGPS